MILPNTRIVLPEGAKRPPSASTCGVSGCATFTRHGKPFCVDHIAMLPYAAEVAAELAKARKNAAQRERRRRRAAS